MGRVRSITRTVGEGIVFEVYKYSKTQLLLSKRGAAQRIKGVQENEGANLGSSQSQSKSKRPYQP